MAELSRKMVQGGYKVRYGTDRVDEFINAVVDHLGAIEALAHPQPANKPIKTDLIIFEAGEIIKLAEAFSENN